MAFDTENATPEQLTQRLIRFKKRAPFMPNDRYQVALHSFPVDHHDAVEKAVKAEGPTDIFKAEPIPLGIYYREPDLTPEALQQINDTLKAMKGDS